MRFSNETEDQVRTVSRSHPFGDEPDHNFILMPGDACDIASSYKITDGGYRDLTDDEKAALAEKRGAQMQQAAAVREAVVEDLGKEATESPGTSSSSPPAADSAEQPLDPELNIGDAPANNEENTSPPVTNLATPEVQAAAQADRDAGVDVIDSDAQLQEALANPATPPSEPFEEAQAREDARAGSPL